MKRCMASCISTVHSTPLSALLASPSLRPGCSLYQERTQQMKSESNPLYGTKRNRNTRRSKTAYDADSFLSIHGKSHREPSSSYVHPGQSVADHKHLQPVHHHARGYEPVHGSRLSHPASSPARLALAPSPGPPPPPPPPSTTSRRTMSVGVFSPSPPPSTQPPLLQTTPPRMTTST